MTKWHKSQLKDMAESIIEICDEEIEIEGRGDDRHAYVKNSAIQRIINYLKPYKIPVRCSECTTLMIYQENDDLVCPNCGVVE